MSRLSINIPLFYCLIRKEYLYDLKDGFGEYEQCSVFGITSIPSRAITFTCMLNNGSQVARLPISAFCWKEVEPQPLEVLQLWDCFSYDLTLESKPSYKVNTHVWKCEGQSKWYIEDSDKYFYDIEKGN
jgi:hypothetical protein